MKHSHKLILTVIGIGLSIGWIVYYLKSPSAQTTRTHQALGYRLAVEACPLVQDSGRLVLILNDAKKHPQQAAQLKAFHAELHHHPNVSVAATVTPKSYDVGGAGRRMELSVGYYVELIEAYPHADAFVSFAGAPRMTEAERKLLPKKLVPLVAIGHPRRETAALLDLGLLRSLLVPRYAFPAPVLEPKTLAQWFDKYFQVITRADQLPRETAPSGK